MTFKLDEIFGTMRIDVSQSKYFRLKELATVIGGFEENYSLIDESRLFRNAVNFQLSEVEPYQHWFRYREGYSRKLVGELMKRADLDPTRHFIADPMVGSGTTAIEACSQGFDVLCMDVNPLSQLLVKLKTLRPSNAELDEIAKVSAELASEINRGETAPKLTAFSEYFNSSHAHTLMVLRKRIDAISESWVKDVCFSAWLFCLEDCSNRKRDGNGLATRTTRVKDPQKFFLEKLDLLLADYRRFPLNSEPEIQHCLGPAKNIASEAAEMKHRTGKELGAVLFSPPYANSFDYFESYKVELVLGGFLKYEDLRTAKKVAIRNYRISSKKNSRSNINAVELLSCEIEAAIPKKELKTGKKDARTRLVPNMIRAYFDDMRDVLASSFEALGPLGKCFIVVDQSAYVGTIVPTDTILAHIGEELGFRVDSINVCRKAATSAQQMKEFPYLKSTLRESVVVLTKPRHG